MLDAQWSLQIIAAFSLLAPYLIGLSLSERPDRMISHSISEEIALQSKPPASALRLLVVTEPSRRTFWSTLLLVILNGDLVARLSGSHALWRRVEARSPCCPSLIPSATQQHVHRGVGDREKNGWIHVVASCGECFRVLCVVPFAQHRWLIALLVRWPCQVCSSLVELHRCRLLRELQIVALFLPIIKCGQIKQLLSSWRSNPIKTIGVRSKTLPKTLMKSLFAPRHDQPEFDEHKR